MFGRKNQAVSTSVPLGEADEGALHLLAAAILQMRAGVNADFRSAFDTPLKAVQAELTRRWQGRGAPAVVEWPERMPAVSIEFIAGAFRVMAAGLRPPPEVHAATNGAADTAAASMVAGAADLLERLGAAVLECKVAASGD